MQVAKDLDLTRSALKTWVRQARADAGQGPSGALTSSEKEEFTQLRCGIEYREPEGPRSGEAGRHWHGHTSDAYGLDAFTEALAALRKAEGVWPKCRWNARFSPD